MTEAIAQVQSLIERPAWKALAAHHQTVRHLHLRELFAGDPLRGGRLAAEAAGLYLDYSKNRVTDEAIGLLLRLADECSLAERIDAMFSGARINNWSMASWKPRATSIPRRPCSSFARRRSRPGDTDQRPRGARLDPCQAR